MVMLGILVPYFIISGDPDSYIRAALITCIVMAISMVIFLPGMHESEAVKTRYLQVYEYTESVKLPYFKFLKIAFKQRNYKIGVFAWLMFAISYSLYYASTLYFVPEVLHLGMEAIALAALTYTIAFMISIFIWSRFIADRIDHYNLYALGLLLLGICYLASMWITTMIEYVLWHILGGIGIAAFSAVFMSVGADVRDEVTNACERHQEAALGGISNFFYRFSFFVIGFTIAITHILTGYVPGAAEQTELAKLGIRINVGLIPALACFAGAFVMFKFYDLKGEKRELLMKSLREKGL